MKEKNTRIRGVKFARLGLILLFVQKISAIVVWRMLIVKEGTSFLFLKDIGEKVFTQIAS